MADSLLPGSINDERARIFEELARRIGAIAPGIVEVYDIDNVEASALIHLADQFNVLGLRGWNLASNEDEQRALVKEAIALHKKAGTPFAVLRALALVGYPGATMEENPPLRYDGSWSYDGSEQYIGKRLDGFIVVLDPVQAEVSATLIDLIVSLINEWKNARTHLLDLRIGNISLFSNLLQYDGSWSYDGDQEYDGIKNI